MDTAEEWAKRLGTVVMTEEQFVQLDDRRVNRHIMGRSSRAIDDMNPAEVYEYVAGRKARGEGLVGVLPPYTGPGNLIPTDSPLHHDWDDSPSRIHRQKVRVVFVDPDPHPVLADPDAVTFTPEDAIARVKQRPRFGMMRVHSVGPITEVNAALMTMPEVRALLDHDTPPGRPGTVPGALVCLVVVHGSFELVGPFGSTPGSPSVAFEVCDSRTGRIFWLGARNKDIILP